MIDLEDSTSGALVDEYEGVNREFTDLETIATRGHNVLTRAKRHGRWQALKSLTTEAAGKEVYRQMLRKEMEILMQLQHPSVEQVMGMEDVPGLGECIVMEWVDGVTLDKWLDQHQSLDQRRRVLGQLLDAMAYVHSCGIVHRDLKPSNIMVTTNGNNVKVIDFGLADTDAHAVLKQPAGTLRYMAPEQASSNRPDVRNDIYSLGMVMRTMNLGRGYRRAIARCLAPIDARFESVEQLQEWLGSYARRRRYVVWGVAAVAAVGLIVLVMTQQAALHQLSRRNDVMVDSLQTRITENTRLAEERIDSSTTVTAAHITAMNDTLRLLRQINEQMEQREQQRLARQRAVDEAIDEGVRIAREANQKTHISEHLDTLSNNAYIWLDARFLIKEGRRHANEYLMNLSKFSPKERAEIEYAINEYCTDYERRMEEKYNHAIYTKSSNR